MQCFDMAKVRLGMAEGERLNVKMKAKAVLVNGIELLANILKVDPHIDVLEYKPTCKRPLELIQDGRPLANVSNCQVWEEVLSTNFHTTLKPARPPLQVMPVLVRFYIAVEDGSAQVERDLGVLTGEGAAYKGGKEQLYDDLLVLKGGPEVCADDVCELGDVRRLGPLGQRWATLWRAVFGARLGIYRASQVGERRGFKKGTYVACKAGILAAAENAVLAKNAESAWSVDDNEDRSTLFKSAHGDESFNNEKLKRFAEHTKIKRLSNYTYIQRAMSKWTAKRAAATAKPLENVLSICFVAGVGEVSLLATEVESDSANG